MPSDFYRRPAEEVARALLGALLVCEVEGERCAGRIVETEAYTGPEDEASHAHLRVGRTPRNEAMFGPPGLAYVYRIYGVHWCLNAVTGAEGFPAAVLIRSAEPLLGEAVFAARRPGRAPRDWMRGPGNLTRAFGIGAELNHHPLGRPPLWIAPGKAIPPDRVRAGPRIGITRAADLPLRFWEQGSRWVSGYTGARGAR